MLIRAFVIASAVFMTGLAFNIAMAEDPTLAPSTQAAAAAPLAEQPIDNGGAVSGVSFAEPSTGLGAVARTLGMQMGFREAATARPAETADTTGLIQSEDGDRRRYELALSATEVGGTKVDVGVAPRATVHLTPEGDVQSTGGGLEARIGQRLRNLVGEWETPTWDNPTWYFFIADDDEAVAWTPNARSNGRRSLSYQEDRVEIGDTSIGIAMEAAGAQAAIAYVERDIQGKYGSVEENFTGLTLTWRR